MKPTSFLEDAAARRRSFDAELIRTNAYRLFCGEREGIPGFVADRYGDVLVFQYHEGKWDGALAPEELAQWFGNYYRPRAIYLKRFIVDRSRAKADTTMLASAPLWGAPIEEEFSALEHGMKFAIRAYDGFSTGLFLDQRENRKWLGERSAGRAILNCFAYTCGFSVAAALGGGRVTSVDLSRRYLKWGERNFALNALPIDAHRFVAADTFEYLRLAKKKGLTFDGIILDPPSFSRNARGEVFSIERDLERLITESAALLGKDGWLYFSSNFSGWSSADVAARATAALRGTGLRSQLASLPEVPVDFSLETSPLSRIFLTKK